MSSSSLTLGDVRDAHYDLVSGNRDDARFLRILNDAVERIYNNGKWSGLVGVVEFENPTGFITLPRRYSAILGVQFGGTPRSTFTRYFEYSVSGPGDLDSTGNMTHLVDQGDVATSTVFETPSQLTLSAASDPSALIRVFGIDGSGVEIFTGGAPGEVLVHGGTTASTFAEITAVYKPLTTGFVTLSAGSTVLSRYEPTETNPVYRRYKVGTHEAQTLRCLCKRRFVRLVNDTDPVYPANLGALKLAILAVVAENAADVNTAAAYWGSCFQVLDSELKEVRGRADIRASFSPSGLGIRPLRSFM